MKWPWKNFLILALQLAAVWYLYSTRPTSRKAADADIAAKTATASAAATHSAPPAKTEPLIGEIILRDYATPVTSPENDLTSLAHLMDNFTLLVKSASTLPLSANEDWAAALRGENPAHERFLPDHHIALDTQGRLVDRWGTPLFFHALGSRQFELRSAGPDKKLWTDDDVHRNANGSFRHGAELNPASLLGSAPH